MGAAGAKPIFASTATLFSSRPDGSNPEDGTVEYKRSLHGQSTPRRARESTSKVPKASSSMVTSAIQLL